MTFADGKNSPVSASPSDLSDGFPSVPTGRLIPFDPSNTIDLCVSF